MRHIIDYVRQPAIYDDGKTLAENKLRDRGSVRCDCGAEVDLEGALYAPDYAAECDNCGSLFNLVGQALKPKSQWEEE